MRYAKRISHPTPIRRQSVFENDTLYPTHWATGADLPLKTQFEVISDGTMGRGIRAKVGFARGSLVGRFTGQLMGNILQHTLQVTPTSHVHDPYFIGLLSHSCAPNCLLDMDHLELLALTNIEPGEILSVDYALTEDTLFRQFPCSCGSSNCRHWVTGRREGVNPEGIAYLARRKQ